MIARWASARPMIPVLVLILAGLGLAGCASQETRQVEDPLGLEPQDSPAAVYVQMAEEYYKRGQREIALRNARQAIEADAGYPKAQVWIAYLYEEMGQTELALQHYERALALSPNNPDVLYAVGAWQCRQGHYAEADRHFKQAIDHPLYATPWVAMTNAGDCTRRAGDNAKADAYYRAALRINPSLGPALVGAAEIEYQRGNLEGAKRYLDRFFDPATVRTPATARPALTLAVQIERRLGNRARADEYERALRASDPSAPAIRAP